MRPAMPASDAAFRQLLHGLPGVDEIGTRDRVAALATRSIKNDAKLAALDLAIRTVDLTTLEGADTPGKVAGLCAKARRPDPLDPRVPPGCGRLRLPRPGQDRQDELAGGDVAVASVATAFPSGRASLPVKLADVADAVAAGADEVDMVIDRGAFLAGRYGKVFEEIQAVREACGTAHLKVILETGELATLDNVCRASWLAMLAGADFIKTSTGKVSPAATPPVALVMLAAVRDYELAVGRQVGVKFAGGIRTAKDAIRYLVLVNETAGPAGSLPRCSGSAPPACLTTCSCSAASSSPASTPDPTTSPSTSATMARKDAGHVTRAVQQPQTQQAQTQQAQTQQAQTQQAQTQQAQTQQAQTQDPTAQGPLGWAYAPAPQGREMVTIAPEYGLFIDGQFAPAADGRQFATINPATEEPLAQVAEAGQADVDPPSPPPPAPTGADLGADARRRRAKYLYRSPGAISRRAERVRRPGEPGQRQADPRVPGHRRPARRRALLLYAGWAGSWSTPVGAAPARSASPPGRPVEAPTADRRLEARSRASPPGHLRA